MVAVADGEDPGEETIVAAPALLVIPVLDAVGFCVFTGTFCLHLMLGGYLYNFTICHCCK